VNGNPPDNTMGQMGDLASLLTWNETDPSDDFEMNRNNYIYTWQMNRNPFIDYPELANYIFGSNFGDQWFAPLSLEDNNFSDVKVYPIPAKDEINISGIENDANVTIFSLEGVQVYQSKINGFTQLNLNLASGMYLMNIETDNQKLTKKIIIK
jgi:hypothetical protein